MWTYTEQRISCGHNIFISLLFVEKVFAVCNIGELYCDASNVVLHYKYPKQWQWFALRLVRLLYLGFYSNLFAGENKLHMCKTGF